MIIDKMQVTDTSLEEPTGANDSRFALASDPGAHLAKDHGVGCL
jgi:hypothetical protein